MDYGFVPGQLAHFSINASDMDRARSFYEKVFGWKYYAYGPPGFYMIESTPAASAPKAAIGSLQGRRELIPGVRMTGFECTIAVADIDKTIAAVEASGGKIVLEKCTLPAIGHLMYFQDPEGNIVGAMQYESNAD